MERLHAKATVGFGETSENPSGQPTLLLLHHMQPPLEWQRAVAVIRATVGPSGSSLMKTGAPVENHQQSLNPEKLQQLLRDIQWAVHEGFLERMALLKQGALPPPGLGVSFRGPLKGTPQGPRTHQVLQAPAKPSQRAYKHVTRLFAAVPQLSRQLFFSRALPLLIEACLSVESIFPICTNTLKGPFASNTAAAAPAAAAGSSVDGRGRHLCACGSCRLRLQLYKHCSSGACSSSSSRWTAHVASCAAELSAGEGWVLFGLGFLGVLPPPQWQETATGFPDLGDLSFADFYDLAAPEQAAKLHCFIRYCCCMAASVEAFHAKCLPLGVPPFAFAPPHVAALCCTDTRGEETVRVQSLLLEKEVRCLLPEEKAAAAAAAAATAEGRRGDGQQQGSSGDSSCSRTNCSCCCHCGTCSSCLWGPSVLATIPAEALREGPPGEGPWPLKYPCCFILRCIRTSRAQAGALCCSAETVALQQKPLLSPEVLEKAVDGGGIPCSAALDTRADFANKVIGGGILYRGALQEEVFFAVCPELLLLRLLSQHLRRGEAGHCRGPLRFSGFRGYARSFRCSLNASRDTRRNPWRDPQRGSQRAQHGEVAEREQTVTKQQQREEPQQQEGPGAPKKRQLLQLESDDEDEEVVRELMVRPRQGPSESGAAITAGWEGWIGAEGVEALDSTPLRVQWLSPPWGLASAACLKEETETTTQEEATQGGRASSSYGRLLRVEVASVVAALDAGQFAPRGPAWDAVVAADVMNLLRDPPRSSAATREVLHFSQQFRIPLMLREVQKVCAALHLPHEEGLEGGTAGAAGVAEGAGGATGGAKGHLRPFTTGNWGCGFFGGDPQLKFLLQWLGASLSGCRMRYFAWGLPELLQGSLLSRVISAILQGPSWDCGKLWRVLLEGSLGSPPPLESMGVFPYVLHRAAAATVPLPLRVPDTRDCSINSSSGSSKRQKQQACSSRGNEETRDGGEVSKRPRRDNDDTSYTSGD